MGHEVLFYQRSLGKGNSVHNRVDAERILKFVERFLFIDELPKFGKVQIKTLYNSGRIQICEKALTNTFKCGKNHKSRMIKRTQVLTCCNWCTRLGSGSNSGAEVIDGGDPSADEAVSAARDPKTS
jgi:hypothetical protein